MPGTIYYFELFDDDRQPCGKRMPDLEVCSEEPYELVVKDLLDKYGDNLQVVYHESDTEGGVPFIVDYESLAGVLEG